MIILDLKLEIKMSRNGENGCKEWQYYLYQILQNLEIHDLEIFGDI